MHTLIQESKQSCNPLSMLIACSFSSKGVYRPLNGTEQLTKDSQPRPHTSPSLFLTWTGCCTPTHASEEFKKNCSIRVEIQAVRLFQVTGTKVNLLVVDWTFWLKWDFVGFHSPNLSCKRCSSLTVVQVNNERELSAIVSIAVPVMHNPTSPTLSVHRRIPPR